MLFTLHMYYMNSACYRKNCIYSILFRDSMEYEAKGNELVYFGSLVIRKIVKGC